MRGSSGSCGRFCETDFGSRTSIPCWRSGAVTMKMTRRTSITSTRGVTLMSDRAFVSSSSRKDIAGSAASGEMALGQVQELQREVVHLRADHPDLAIEVVVGDEGRD